MYRYIYIYIHIYPYIHQLTTKENAAKVELGQNNFSDDGIPTISSIRKPRKSNNSFLTTNHPALKGFCTNDTA